MATSKKIKVTTASVVSNDTLAGYNFYSNVDGKLNVSVVSVVNAMAGVNYSLTDALHNITAKPVGTTNGEFSAVTSAVVVVDLVSFDIDAIMDLANLQTNDPSKFTIAGADKVSEWKDVNPALGSWTQATDAKRPIKQVDGVLFNGLAQTLARATDIDTTDYSFYMVFRDMLPNTGGAYNKALLGSKTEQEFIRLDAKYNMAAVSPLGGKGFAAGYKGKRTIVLSVRKSGSVMKHSINDRSLKELSSGATAITRGLFGKICSGFYDNLGVNAKVKAIMVKSTSLSDIDHKKVVDGLYTRYDLASNTTTDCVVGFGDSNMEGILCDSSIYGLATQMGLGALNLGISSSWFTNAPAGSAKPNGFERYQNQIVTRPYTDYVVVQYSTNDISGGGSSTTYSTQMNSMIASLISQGYSASKICICSPPYIRDNALASILDEYRAVIVSVATTHSIKYFDFLQDMRDNGGNTLLNGGDAVHLNQLGQDRLQAGVYAAFTS